MSTPTPAHQDDHSSPNHPAPRGGSAAALLAELRGGDKAGPEPVAARRPRRLSGQTLVLLLVLGVSAATLFTMRQMSRRSGIRLETVEVAYTPDEDSQRRAIDQARIVRFLAESGKPVQVPRENIEKNPFYLGMIAADLPQGADPAEIEAHRLAELARQEAAAREEAIRTQLASMTLHSVLGGRQPIARINDSTVRVGDMVGELFKVVAIEGRRVTLEYDGKQYVLDLDARKDPASVKPGGTPR